MLRVPAWGWRYWQAALRKKFITPLRPACDWLERAATYSIFLDSPLEERATAGFHCVLPAIKAILGEEEAIRLFGPGINTNCRTC